MWWRKSRTHFLGTHVKNIHQVILLIHVFMNKIWICLFQVNRTPGIEFPSHEAITTSETHDISDKISSKLQITVTLTENNSYMCTLYTFNNKMCRKKMTISYAGRLKKSWFNTQNWSVTNRDMAIIHIFRKIDNRCTISTNGKMQSVTITYVFSPSTATIY